jgi:enamine deaminase RidA (YjgF/YER057c/UK114 family)
MARKTVVGGGRPIEAQAGFSRAIRVEEASAHIFVCGNASTNPDGTIYGAGDAYAQAVHILGLMRGYLEQVGASMADVVRTRMYVVDLASHAEEVVRAHGEVFGDILPTSTLLGIESLMHPDMLVEMDADAVV